MKQYTILDKYLLEVVPNTIRDQIIWRVCTDENYYILDGVYDISKMVMIECTVGNYIKPESAQTVGISTLITLLKEVPKVIEANS